MSTTSIRFRHHLESQSNGHNNYKSTALTSHGLFDQLSNWANMWVSSSASTANHQLKVRDPDIYSTRKQYSVIIPRKRKINHNIDIDVSRETDVRTRTNYYHATTMHRQHRTQVPNTNNTAYNKSDMLRVYNCTIQKLQAQQRKRQYKSARPTLSNLIHIRHVWDQIERLIISKSNTNDESATSNIPYLSPAKRFPMYTDKVYLLTHKKLSVSSSSITATAVSTKQKIRASFALSTLVYTTATHQNDITLEILYSAIL
ncbi:hypothetical protein BDF20DRAFT_845630 [Mycotypha africana]|uniref:uncharacterized protein n=1 Tax=Mycotypha africana TaxID=64632 RepID=UPI002301E64C|nr:uncharacterized protein BDF20DRAFT_845630 [Mycotypha africana]KAI8991628.1 hypothetical protein BDF20DRAFT_845630 [Mycotypha africana]